MDNMSFIVSKIEKLSRAVYLVTDFMSDREPLKWRLRHLSVRSVGLIDPAEALVYSDKLIRTIKEMLNLIELSLTTGTVSQMNFTLLQREYKNLLTSLSGDSFKSLSSQIKVEALAPGNANMIQPSLKTDSRAGVLPSSPSISTIKDHSDVIDKRQRQDRILSHIKGRGWLSIKDISDAVPNFSSKTVQRELTELVEKGMVKKKGERRWSRYIANNLTN